MKEKQITLCRCPGVNVELSEDGSKLTIKWNGESGRPLFSFTDSKDFGFLNVTRNDTLNIKRIL